MARVTPRLIALEVETIDRSDEVSSAVITSAAADALGLAPGAPACAVFDASAVILLCV